MLNLAFKSKRFLYSVPLTPDSVLVNFLHELLQVLENMFWCMQRGRRNPDFLRKKIISFWNRIMCISADNGLLTVCVEKNVDDGECWIITFCVVKLWILADDRLLFVCCENVDASG